MTQFYNNLHSLDAFDGGFLKAKKHISMEIVGEPSMIYFHVTCPFELESITEKFISSNYPGATVEPLYDYRYFHENTDQEYISLDLKKDDMYPITKLDDHKTDPINTILNSLSKLNENETAFLQILVRPKKHKWNEDMHKKVERMYENKTEGINYSLWDFISGNLAKSEEPEKNKELTPQQQENLKAIEEKLALPCFETNIRLVTSTPTTPRSKSVLRDLAGSFGHYNTVDQNKFELIQTSKISFLSRRIRKLNQALFRIWDSKEVSVLSGDELSQIFHFPDSRYNKSNLIKWQGYKTFPAPAGMPDEGVLL
ncbi:MAG: hypothetical protein U9Q15_03530 [Patescibacteria group bacterium]|nr:hypothetical protein [Patescibacteria group bacterium]